MTENGKETAARKKAMRGEKADLRNGIPPGDKTAMDKAVRERLFETEYYKNAGMLLTYVSAGSEPDTLYIIIHALAEQKEVACPVCVKSERRLEFYIIENLSQLIQGCYGIYEPDTSLCKKVEYNIIEANSDTLCLVPGLSFDPLGFRLGYGGGYYDRFLPGLAGCAAGLCYESTLENRLPAYEYDRKVNIIVTEKRLIHSGLCDRIY